MPAPALPAVLIGNEMDMTLVNLEEVLLPATIMVVSVTGSTTNGKVQHRAQCPAPALRAPRLRSVPRACACARGRRRRAMWQAASQLEAPPCTLGWQPARVASRL